MCEQLCCLVDRLRSVEATTSDSGAVSDYSENTDCKSHSLSSLQDYLGESEGNQQDGGKTTLEDVKNNNTLQGASSLESNFSNTRAATEGSIDLPGKLTQPKEEVLGEELPATENTSSDLESSQPSLGVTECGKPTGNQTLSSDSTTENSGERLDEVAKEKVENKREVAPDEQIRIKRKSKRFSGRGYNNWRTCYGYYDNNRNRNSYHDKSRSRGQQYTSSSKDRKVHKPSPFNHEEVAAFLWNSKA